MAMEAKWMTVAATKREALAKQIPKAYLVPSDQLPPPDQLNVTAWARQSAWFSPREAEITESTASQLLAKMAAGTWSSEEVTRAFCRRAAAAQQLV